jgi:SpoVK/Ycf46/Vps4 family AAA+-type ATPase
VHNNSEIYKLINTIYDWITPNERHMLLLEDFDRSELFKRWGGNTSVTMDCILDVLDARGANGRITFITANDIDKIKNSDAFDAMFRPGRIDRMIEINYCSIDQIHRILDLYFDDGDVDLDDNIKVTVAELNKIIQLKQELSKVVIFLNKFISFESGGHIEELCKMDTDDINIEEIDMEEINKKVNIRKNKTIKKSKPQKIYGEVALNKLEKSIADDEFELINIKDKNAVDYQLKYWALEKKKIILKEKQKLIELRKAKKAKEKEILDDENDEDMDNDVEDKKKMIISN